MPFSFVKVAIGDEVAILPSADAIPAKVIEIATVARANQVYIELQDGRCYAAIGGHCLLNGSTKTFIVPATNAHKRALASREQLIA
jgi:hypothetical protein